MASRYFVYTKFLYELSSLLFTLKTSEEFLNCYNLFDYLSILQSLQVSLNHTLYLDDRLLSKNKLLPLYLPPNLRLNFNNNLKGIKSFLTKELRHSCLSGSVKLFRYDLDFAFIDLRRSEILIITLMSKEWNGLCFSDTIMCGNRCIVQSKWIIGNRPFPLL